MSQRFPVLRQKMPGFILALVETLWPDWEERLFRKKSRLKGWYRNTLGMMFRLLLLVAAVVLLCVVLLVFAKGFWEVYLSTPMGQSFVNFSWRTTSIVSHLLAQDFVVLSLILTGTSLAYLLFVAAVGKFVVAKRYFYDGQGMIFKSAWMALCCLLVAKEVGQLYRLDSGVALLISIVPVACLFGSSFSFASQVVPEFNVVGIVKYFFRLHAEVRMRKYLNR